MMTSIWKIISLLVSTIIVAISAQAEEYRVIGNHFPPFGIVENNKISGFSIDLLNLIFEKSSLKRCDCQILPTSFNRVYNEVDFGDGRIGLHVARTEERQKQFKWVGPYYVVEMGLIAKKFRFGDVKTLKALKGKKVGVVRNTAPDQLLRKSMLDHHNIISVPQATNMVKMLSFDRLDFIAHVYDVTAYIMQDMGMDPNLYEIKYNLANAYLHFAFSKDTSDEVIKILQASLDDLIHKPAYLQLLKKYNLQEKIF